MDTESKLTSAQDRADRGVVTLLHLNISLPSDENVGVVCGPVVGKVGVDSAVLLLELDQAAVGE